MNRDLVPTPRGFINLVEGTLIFGSIAPKTTHILTEGMWHHTHPHRGNVAFLYEKD